MRTTVNPWDSFVLPNPDAVTAAGLDEKDLDTLRGLLQVWGAKTQRNRKRSLYYDAKNALKDLGIAIPPALKQVETVVGWPAKSVDLLQQRINFDGFVVPGEEQDPYGLEELLQQNRFEVELPQAVRSALTHSVAFLETTLGDEQAGEPPVMMNFRSAMYATGAWDQRRRALSAALSIADVDKNGVPTELTMFLPDKIVYLSQTSGYGYATVQRRNPLGFVPVEPLVFRPDLDRPFGRSRISRAVMSITDAAVRTVLRTEVSAEFFTSPQRYLLGADESAFVDADDNRVSSWQAVLGRLLAIGKDEDGDIPTVGQFSQMSMQPHSDMLRSLATQFAGETSIPINSLGVIQDNPSSAEAIFAAREDLIVEAQAALPVLGAALTRSARTAVMLRDRTTSLPGELSGLRAKWRKPDRPSIVSASDAIVKQVSAIPWLADTEVVLEELGYDHATITRLLTDKHRAQAGAGLTDQLAALGRAGDLPA